MVRIPSTENSVSNPIDNSDWSGTETKDMELFRTQNQPNDTYSLYRYVNGLDVNVDIDVQATDGSDDDYSDTEDLRGGNASDSTLTVSNGSVDSDYITEPWERVRIQVTPASNPSSGTFEVREFRVSIQ